VAIYVRATFPAKIRYGAAMQRCIPAMEKVVPRAPGTNCHGNCDRRARCPTREAKSTRGGRESQGEKTGCTTTAHALPAAALPPHALGRHGAEILERSRRASDARRSSHRARTRDAARSANDPSSDNGDSSADRKVVRKLVSRVRANAYARITHVRITAVIERIERAASDRVLPRNELHGDHRRGKAKLDYIRRMNFHSF